MTQRTQQSATLIHLRKGYKSKPAKWRDAEDGGPKLEASVSSGHETLPAYHQPGSSTGPWVQNFYWVFIMYTQVIKLLAGGLNLISSPLLSRGQEAGLPHHVVQRLLPPIMWLALVRPCAQTIWGPTSSHLISINSGWFKGCIMNNKDRSITPESPRI